MNAGEFGCILALFWTAAMKTEAIEHADLNVIVAAIARSQISIRLRTCRQIESRLPAGFDLVDVAILDWIATTSDTVSNLH